MTRAVPRILAIDDEPDNVLLIEHALRRLGYAGCVTETDPHRAVARFRQENFDLVLLDYNMPELNGLDVLALIGDKARREQVPVIVITAQTDRDTRLLSLKAGARDFLNKPLDLAELGARVNNLLEVRQLQCELRYTNLDLESKVLARTRELRDSRLEAIRRLARAVEFRDKETGYHVKRMSLYAETIGRTLGLPDRDLELLLNACPMHDVGKIGIADAILLKRGKLTDDEFAVMQTHTTIGAEILSGHDSELLRAAHAIALAHHECWNGQGYPHGLSGDAIPLLARIAAVADVFDALTMMRPYKHAWPVDEAVSEILRQSGQHFDPAVVTAFTGCLDLLLTIRATHLDHLNDQPSKHSTDST